MTARLSVVMAVKDAVPYIEPSVQSVLSQTFPDFEFVIVDDGSRDGTLDYLRSLRDSRVKVLQSRRQGQTAALNDALRACSTDWVARMDGDDWSYPKRLELQWTAVGANPRAVLVSSDYMVCDEFLNPVAPVRLQAPNEGLFEYLRTKNNPFCHPAMVFHRGAALDLGGYDETLKNAQDYRLWIQLLDRGELVHVPQLLVKYRVLRTSLSILRQPEQSDEKNRISRPWPAGKETPAPAAVRYTKASDVNGMYAYRLGFSAWLAGKRTAVLRYAVQALFYGMRPLQSLIMLLTLPFPRRLYLAVCGFGKVYR